MKWFIEIEDIWKEKDFGGIGILLLNEYNEYSINIVFLKWNISIGKRKNY